MSFMPLSGCTFWRSASAQLLTTFTCTTSLANLYFLASTAKHWAESMHLNTVTCTSLLATKYLHTSTAKTGTEDVHLITFTPQIWNLELKTSAWQPSLVQLHSRNNACITPVPTLNCTQPLDHMHLRSFTCQQIQGHLQWETWSWKPPLDNFPPWTCTSFLHVRKPTILECGIQQLTPPGNHIWRMYTCKPFLDTPHFDSFIERHARSQRKTSNNLKLHMFHLLVSSPGPSLAAIHLLSYQSFFKTTRHFTWFVSLDRLLTWGNTATSCSDGSQRKASANAFQLKNKAFGLNMLYSHLKKFYRLFTEIP